MLKLRRSLKNQILLGADEGKLVKGSGHCLVEFRILCLVLRNLSFDFNGIFNQWWTDGISMGGSLMGKEFLSPSVSVWDFIIETMF